MASIEQIKNIVDLNDLANRLGLERPHGNGNYKSPHRNDKHPSLSIYADSKSGIKKWKDHGSDMGGSCIDLVQYVHDIEFGEAVDWLRAEYNIPDNKPINNNFISREKTKVEWVADQCFANATDTINYLVEKRKIAKEVVDEAIKNKTVGFSNYCTVGKKYGQYGYGGDAVAFICKDVHTKRICTVEYRYLDALGNGGVKSHCHGNKGPSFWMINQHKLSYAHTVILVESPINALSIESCNMKGYVAVATMGATNLHEKDWRLFEGKFVVCAFDNDKPNEKEERPGAKAAWYVHETLTKLNISCMFIDQTTDQWAEINDVNDYLQTYGENELKLALRKLESCLIPGLPCQLNDADKSLNLGRPRVYLPPHDYAKYWTFQVKADFTHAIKVISESDGNGGMVEKIESNDLCAFRITALSRVTIQSATATMSGEVESQPKVVFSAVVQSARHKANLIKKVLDDEQVHNLERWAKFGSIYNKALFARMLGIMERATEIGSTNAVNFVGIAYKDQRLTLNEGKNCYFTEPEKQCPYHNLSFPSTSINNASIVISAYQKTFKNNAATIMLAWSLGAHLKAVMGFWPHMVLQANKALAV